jgi:predicted transcriptional regulator
VSKKERIARFTDDELRAMQARGEDQSDWKRAAGLSESEIEAVIAADADEAEMIFDWSRASIAEPYEAADQSNSSEAVGQVLERVEACEAQQIEEIEAALAEAECGDFATDEEVAEVVARYRAPS